MNEHLDEFMGVLGELQQYRQTHQLEEYKPYPFQLEFHNAIGHGTDKPATQKSLVCGNKIGKTLCASNEMAIHMTGQYDKYPWYDGMKFDRGIEALCGTYTIEQTRDILQATLLGPPGVDEAFGTGSIPKDLIIHAQRRPGYGTAFDFVDVKHVPSDTRSRLYFRAFEIGEKKHMGRRVDLAWLDEEAPFDILMQMVRGGLAIDKALRLLTFTPERGFTRTVIRILNDIELGEAVVRAGWKDCPHMLKNFDEKVAAIPKWQRPFRVDGIPTIGEGAVFPVDDEQFMCEPIEIPPHWPRICGIDIAMYAHPFACAWLAHDRDSGITYVYKIFRKSQMKTAEEAAVIKGNNPWIPVMWPHDAAKHDKESGKTYRDILAGDPYNCKMHPKPFSNPPHPGMPEGSGGQGVEVGLNAMHNAMEDGTLKVFRTCKEFFEEKNMYYRRQDAEDKWVLVKKNDDAISAVRYAYMMQRFAITKPRKYRKRPRFTAAADW